jgi:plastocyanin
MKMVRMVAPLALATMLAAVSATYGVSAAGASTATTWTVQVGQQSHNGAIQGMAYGPGEIWIDVGDTVHWVANSMEPHTVSFLDAAHPPGPFDPSGYMVVPTPETTIDAPGEFRNSGIIATMSDPALPPAVTSYDLTFTGPGDYHYMCYLHGQAMQGTVHVRDAGTPYPLSQRDYNAQANAIRSGVLDDGYAQWGADREASDAHHVFVGSADSMAMVMRFVNEKVTIRTGETVTFDWGRNAAPVPHTVTFGDEPPTLAPVGDPTDYSGGTLSSGAMLGPLFMPPGAPSTYAVTFTAPGTYHYLCMFHDGMGMVGTVVVH